MFCIDRRPKIKVMLNYPKDLKNLIDGKMQEVRLAYERLQDLFSMLPENEKLKIRHMVSSKVQGLSIGEKIKFTLEFHFQMLYSALAEDQKIKAMLNYPEDIKYIKNPSKVVQFAAMLGKI